jgi:hypothetical protein
MAKTARRNHQSHKKMYVEQLETDIIVGLSTILSPWLSNLIDGFLLQLSLGFAVPIQRWQQWPATVA